MAGVISLKKNGDLKDEDAPLIQAHPPAPLAIEAFHGPAGRLVQKMEPETEADSFSLLLSTLAVVGNIMGRSPFVMGGNSKHYPCLFVALVGETSKARKGTSWTVVRDQAKNLDFEWAKNCTSGGLSTGEGLIWMLHDQVEKQEPVKEKGKVTGYQTIITDPGITDKRLMVVEGEFGQQLKVMQREGNTLSAIIRNAWDSPPHLRAMSKASASIASNPHLSIIGHITQEELKQLLSKSDTFNGFSNRFIWGYVKRSKLLPEGGHIDLIDFSSDRRELQNAISSARKGGRYEFDREAQAIWNAGYTALSAPHPGIFGAVTSRSEAQVMRLSLLYALLDSSKVIQAKHLQAALAVWKFSEDSAQFLFGNSESRSDANRILTALRTKGVEGMSKNEISRDIFGGNVDAHRINEALTTLKNAGFADFRNVETAGRSREVWFPIQR